MRLLDSVLAALALGAVVTLVVPGREALGFAKSGFSLAAESERDFRVFNNFADPTANDNLMAHAQFPGWTGAELAIWKAAVEWGSVAHGDGSGDPTQSVLGDGGANFDYYWAGGASGPGGPGSRILSALPTCGGGLLAFTESAGGGGWRIRFCDEWVWHDGPGPPPGGPGDLDIQGVAIHELGHALGLAHSGIPGATMFAGVGAPSATQARSIEPDDQAGVQCVYGAASAGKPRITSVSVSGGTVVLRGSGFSAAGGQVWFTNDELTAPEADPYVRVIGASSSGGGTQIAVLIPEEAGAGDVLVKQAGTGHATLSNAFPFDLSGSGGVLSINSVIPPTVENLIPGTAQSVTINGTGFTTATTVELDGVPIAGSFTVASSAVIAFEWEPVAGLGPHLLAVRDGGQSASATISVAANAAPTLQAGDGEPGNVVTGFAPLTMGGQPGDLHYVVVSTSSVPSMLPGKILLDLGNSFQELVAVGLYAMDASGLALDGVPLGSLSATTLYWQSLEIELPIAQSYPLESSNLQSTFTP